MPLPTPNTSTEKHTPPAWRCGLYRQSLAQKWSKGSAEKFFAATGIIRKNSKVAARYKELGKKLDTGKERMAVLQKQIDAVHRRLTKEQTAARYRVEKTKIGEAYHSQNYRYTADKRASIIADAFMGNPEVVKLVAT